MSLPPQAAPRSLPRLEIQAAQLEIRASLSPRHVSPLPSPHRPPRGSLRTFAKQILILRPSIRKDLAVHPSLTLPLRVANRHPCLLAFRHVSLTSPLITLIISPFSLQSNKFPTHRLPLSSSYVTPHHHYLFSEEAMVEVEEIELDLALSIGGTFGKHTVDRPAPDSKPDSFTRLALEPHDKREIQALRRMEAKKKREQKRERVRDTEPEFEHLFKKEKTECQNAVSGFAPWRTAEPFRVQQFAPMQYFPLNNGFPLPCWVGGQKNAGGVDGVNGFDKKVAKSNGSSRCSSSAVSDYQSSSREGIFIFLYFLF